MNKIGRVKLHENGSHVYTGEVEYDGARGNLAKFAEKVGTGFTKYETTFGYDNEDRPVTLSYDDTNNQTILTYDGLGDVTNRTVKVGGYSFNTIIGYTDGAYGTNSTTGLLRHMFQGNENFVYYYDNVGNISYMYRTGKYTGYVYDALGQLIRVNDQTDTTSGAAGTTWTYEYDRGGNIISKSRYAFTTGALGTALETIVYGYGDYNWMDKLTSYNSSTISYDAIGNPTGDGTWTYTWEKGRQLKQMTKSGTTVAFAYNADGLRVRKTVNGVATNYILHGKNIVHMTQGADTLHFWYDAQGRPAIVDFNGTKYAYIHNLQGDIVGIIDSTGAEVVQYTYDAWGKVLNAAGMMASTLGTVQPFRYRGYVYDVETGLYYLRSRYYNPEWGRFINADSLIRGNLFAYCYNMPNLYVDNSGRTPREIIDYNMRVLVEYLKKEGNESDAQEYWFGSLLGDMVNIREKPGLGHDIIYCIENVHDVRAIYINEHWEWDQPRNNQKKSKKLNASPVIIWFPVLVFTNRDKTPYKGYIAANYVSPLYGLNKEERQIKPITFDFKTTSNSRSIEKGGPVSYFPFFVEEINGEEWLYCSTGFGTGWIKRTVIEDD